MRKEGNELGRSARQTMRGAALGAAAALVLCLPLLLLAALGIWTGRLPEGEEGRLTAAVCALAACGGSALTLRHGGRGALHGVLTGGLFFATLLAAGAAFLGVRELHEQNLAALAACLAGGALPCVLRPRRKGKAKRHTVKKHPCSSTGRKSV